MRRGRVNKRKSMRKFRHQASRTPSINLRRAPMRGGIRL